MGLKSKFPKIVNKNNAQFFNKYDKDAAQLAFHMTNTIINMVAIVHTATMSRIVKISYIFFACSQHFHMSHIFDRRHELLAAKKNIHLKM